MLSSDVALTDRSAELVVVAVLGRRALEDGPTDDAVVLTSVLGAGHDLVFPAGDAFERARHRLAAAGAVEVGREAPRPGGSAARRRGWGGFRRDASRRSRSSSPRSTSRRDASSARSPWRRSGTSGTRLVLRAVRSGAPLRRGAHVLADGHPVGEITSAATDDRGRPICSGALGGSLALSTEAGPLSLRSKR